MQTFIDSENFEYLLIFSLLSQTPVSFPNPNTAFSKSFLTLLDKLTTNTKVTANGNQILFSPGSITGGKIKHDCTVCMTAYLKPLIILAPFSSTPFHIALKGITNGKGMSIDAFKRCVARSATDFGVDCHIEIKKRGFHPGGGGEVLFSCNIVNQLKCIDKSGTELAKIRGLAISAHVNASVTHKLINNMRDRLNKLTGDISMRSDIANKRDSGPSPGYACVVFAEKNTGNCIYGECNGTSSDDAVKDLCIAIENSGYYDFRVFGMIACFMCLSIEDYGRVCIKRLEKDDFGMLELLRRFFGFEYKLDANEDEVFFGAFGVGYKNIFKVMQ